jgi:O-antigen/teichoic acid export membrane protein
MSAESASVVDESVPPPMIAGVAGADAVVPVKASLPKPVLASLRIRALRGSAWTIGDYVVGRGLSLASNVLLSWMLMPLDAFGLMATVSVFLMGLQMFSDIGIGPNIIFSKRGDRPEFLNTAWTIQVVRGVALFIASCLIAWPVALLYEEPRLIYLLPICGFLSVIHGFISTSLVTLNRQMRLGVMTMLDIIGQVLQILTMIAWAYWVSLDVWSLVVGSYVGSIFRVIYSHKLVSEHRVRFGWNREDARSMFHFGRWIFLSTVLTFLASQLDRLMFAKMLGMTMAGIYNIAVQFAIVPQHLIKKIGSVVAFPVLAEIVRDRPEQMPWQFRRVRYPIVLVSLGIVITLVVLAKPIINLLYPNGGYERAGPMLRILAVGAMGGMLNSTYGSALLAMGKTFHIMALLASQIVILVVATSIGYHRAGDIGFIWGVALVEWLNYPFTAAVMSRFGLWQPRIDVPAMVVCALAVVLAFWVLP